MVDRLPNFGMPARLFSIQKVGDMKTMKTPINPIYRDLIIVLIVSLGIAIGSVSIAVMVLGYLL
jgi:hypothetical protein